MGSKDLEQTKVINRLRKLLYSGVLTEKQYEEATKKYLTKSSLIERVFSHEMTESLSRTTESIKKLAEGYCDIRDMMAVLPETEEDAWAFEILSKASDQIEKSLNEIDLVMISMLVMKAKSHREKK